MNKNQALSIPRTSSGMVLNSKERKETSSRTSDNIIVPNQDINAPIYRPNNPR